MRATRGFTLIEMMITIAIVGLLVGLSVMGYTMMVGQGKEKAAVRELYLLALQARQEARTRGQPVRISVREVTQSGVKYQAARWERLPCSDLTWGGTCPTAACAAAHHDGGCTHAILGKDVIIPTSVTTTDLDGLCFLGSTAQPRDMACDEAAPAVTSVKLQPQGVTAPYHLVIEPLTGAARVLDCGAKMEDPRRAELCP